MRLLLGTTKGLITYEKKGSEWKFDRIDFPGLPVSMIHYQTTTDTWWVALSIKHWGPKLFHSNPSGDSWLEKTAPKYPEVALLGDKPATLKLIWSAAHHPESQRMWLGTEPGGLFYSDDMGEQWHLSQSLWNHESRPDHWFGGGRNQAGIHSIKYHPKDPDTLYVSVSCAGVFKSSDHGQTWEGKNQGLKAEYLPNPSAPYGHDPHALEICEVAPQVIWQQNHCGVFLSTDSGDNWKDVTPADGYGKYGFPIVIDPMNPAAAWIIPAESDEQRIAKDQRLVVCKTTDFGATWDKQTRGLPQEHSFDLVFRHAFSKSANMLAFGTTTGNLYLSEDKGESWNTISSNLPPIHSVVLHKDA